MTNFIPIFPLELVVYPGEQLNLHIREKPYQQLIRESVESQKGFGIPPVIKGRLHEYGTLMQVIEIAKTHADGAIDIRARGIKVFRILEVVRDIPEKPYAGAIVHYPDNRTEGDRRLMESLIMALQWLHQRLNIEKSFDKPIDHLSAYDLAHHACLGLEGEYQVLELLHERQRQEFLRRHLKNIRPIIDEIERLKERVKWNGHFRDLQLPKF
ncbi:MAG: LON peptidase substrate-binding domain-containing protein [Thermoflavifilum sp.]|nr:LON peptidase substrate-binding domain-containing protein [Thermoflavifilum sp.]